MVIREVFIVNTNSDISITDTERRLREAVDLAREVIAKSGLPIEVYDSKGEVRDTINSNEWVSRKLEYLFERDPSVSVGIRPARIGAYGMRVTSGGTTNEAYA